MKHNNPIPPQSAERLLLWFLRDDLVEEVLGDLEEKFHHSLKQRSVFGSKLNYWYQVLNYLRPFAIRKYRSNSIVFIMYKHNFKIAYRNFFRYKSSFFINLSGLSMGLACAMMIYLWVRDEMSIDKFHEMDSRLFQIMHNFESPSGIKTLEWTPSPLAEALKEDFPDVEHSVRVMPPTGYTFNGVMGSEEHHRKAKAKYVERDFLDLFSHQLIAGQKDRILKDKNAVVISDELAMHFFKSTTNVVGQALSWKQGEFTGDYYVSGVFEKMPANASMQFDLMFSYELYESKHPEMSNWLYNAPCTYISLKNGSDDKAFSKKIAGLTKKNDPNAEGTLFLRKYSDQHLYGNYENGAVSGGRITYVILFSIIAVFIILIACINFMNLSTARASRRFKEIGIKKAVGAGRTTLAVQHLGESLMMSSLALIAALVLVAALIPQFNGITGKQLELNLDFSLVLSLLSITLVTGLVAGSYPALHLSGFHPIRILKGGVITSGRALWVRKGLVIFQFVASVVFILLVVVVHQQMEYIQAKNLGYQKDNVIQLDGEGRDPGQHRTFLNEIRRIPGVVSASAMRGDLMNGDHNNTAGVQWEGRQEGGLVDFTDLVVDFGFFETMGMEMASGRTFSEKYSTENEKIIFNETAIQQMGLSDPVGKTVKLWGRDRQIIGVVRDFHFESLYENVKPCFFRLDEVHLNPLIRIQAGREQETLGRLQDLYRNQNEGVALEYQFMDSAYEQLYFAERRVSTLSRYFAGIAIIISCLGLFGLAAFTAERRLKEIGIRKILGAGNLRIISLLTTDFTKMVLIAVAIALPVSYFIAINWLEGFAFRIDLEWWFFAGAGLLALAIAWLTVSIQTVKAANVNPVECLKDE